jgi:uncharacterized protein with FMN-binding domain
VLGSIFGSIAVLGIGWQVGAAAAKVSTESSANTQPTAAPTPTAAVPSSTPTATATPTPSTTPTAKALPSGSFTGKSVGTRYGSVQVKAVVQAGKITNVIPLHLTTVGGRSVQLSNYAAPILRREVLAAQSAKVHSVGGATYTSDAYLTSLQSALNQAGFSQ